MGVFIVKFNLKSDIVWPPKCPQKLYSLVREGGRTPLCASWYVRWFLNLEAKSADVVSNDGHKVVTNLLRPSAQWAIFFFEIAFSFVTKVLSLLEACFDLISGSSLHMKIQIMGGKITENLGFKSPLRKVKNFLVFFSFHFQILHTKVDIFYFNHFLMSCLMN